MHKHKSKHRVLSIYPTARGYSFVLFDSPLAPRDWGSRDIKKDVGSAKCIASIKEMLDRFRPDVLVLEDTGTRESKRSLRVKRIRKAMVSTTHELSIETALVPYKKVKASFAQFGAINKQDIAETIGRKMEAFAPRMPRARKAWHAEDPRMALFDAASRGLTYYYELEQLDAAHAPSRRP